MNNGDARQPGVSAGRPRRRIRLARATVGRAALVGRRSPWPVRRKITTNAGDPGEAAPCLWPIVRNGVAGRTDGSRTRAPGLALWRPLTSRPLEMRGRSPTLVTSRRRGLCAPARSMPAWRLQRAIAAAKPRIAHVDPSVGRLLRDTIRAGISCAVTCGPDRATVWLLVRSSSEPSVTVYQSPERGPLASVGANASAVTIDRPPSTNPASGTRRTAAAQPGDYAE